MELNARCITPGGRELPFHGALFQIAREVNEECGATINGWSARVQLRFPFRCLPESGWRGTATVLGDPQREFAAKLGIVCHSFWKWRHECFQLEAADELLRAHCGPCWWFVYRAKHTTEAYQEMVFLFSRLKPNACGNAERYCG